MILEPQSKFKLKEIESLIKDSKSFKLSPKSQKAVEKAHRVVQELSHSDEAIYGVNTGFGRLAQMRISENELADLQVNLIRSHASGIGAACSPSVVRRLLLLRFLSLGKGYSGVSVEVLQRHLDYLNKNLSPHIPEQGSVGASGDLAPLAHLALTFIGEGYFVDKKGLRKTAKVALKQAKLKEKLLIGPKEGLSLTNGTQFSLALAMEAYQELQNLLPWMELASCLSIEAHQATNLVYLGKIHELKMHKHQREVARSLSEKLRASPHIRSHRHCDRVQDAYSFRCIPQVVGAALSLIEKAGFMLEDEVNSVSDNPVLFADEKKIYSCGHFHAHYVSMAADMMAMAVATLGNLVERRVDQLVNPLTARAPAFLASRPGVESGLMIVQTAAAALASENKTLASPASADTIPTNGNQEDHVSMAPWASRKLLMMIQNFRRILAAEIICAVRGCVVESTRTGLQFSPFVEQKLKELAELFPNLFQAGDRVFGEDWEKLDQFLKSEASNTFFR